MHIAKKKKRNSIVKLQMTEELESSYTLAFNPMLSFSSSSLVNPYIHHLTFLKEK